LPTSIVAINTLGKIVVLLMLGSAPAQHMVNNCVKSNLFVMILRRSENERLNASA